MNSKCIINSWTNLWLFLFALFSSDSSDKEKPVQSTEFSSTVEMPDYVV